MCEPGSKGAQMWGEMHLQRNMSENTWDIRVRECSWVHRNMYAFKYMPMRCVLMMMFKKQLIYVPVGLYVQKPCNSRWTYSLSVSAKPFGNYVIFKIRIVFKTCSVATHVCTYMRICLPTYAYSVFTQAYAYIRFCLCAHYTLALTCLSIYTSVYVCPSWAKQL